MDKPKSKSWCLKIEPRVISSTLIRKCLNEMAKPGEIERLQREEGTPFEEVQEIRFEFKRIIRIESLWILSSLRKLSLNNNLIEKIINLESLVHLTELNLSFNKINKIENLHTLVNLEILNLFQNQICVIENLDNQKNLLIFSIGNNLIENKSNLLYLRSFRKLKSFNIAGNPCTEDDDFRNYVSAVLPLVIYYEYSMISQEERDIGRENYRHLLLNIEAKEQIEETERLKKEKELAEAQLYSKSFVEYLNESYLFDSLFENDEEGKSFLSMNEIYAFYVDFAEEFVQICHNLFEAGQEQYTIRQEEIRQYNNTVESAKKQGQLEAIEMMENFLEKKNVVFDQMMKLSKKFEDKVIGNEDYFDQLNDTVQTFTDDLHAIWKKSMNFEVTLFGQMQDVNKTFELSLTDLINEFIEIAQTSFSYLRTLQNIYNDNVTDLAFKILTNEDPEVVYFIPTEVEEFFSNKDSLGNALGASHDYHLQVIDNREDVLVERAREWLKNIVENLELDEIERNRNKILEIARFIDLQSEEFKNLDVIFYIEEEEELEYE